MKNDPILSSLINFLVPVIFIYGMFLLSDFFANGFFAFIFAIVLFVSGFMIFSVRFSEAKTSYLFSLESISIFAVLISVTYVITILFLITNIFAL